MTKASYTSLGWAGIGVGLLVFILNVVAMEEPNVVLTWVAIALVVLGIWAAARARNYDKTR